MQRDTSDITVEHLLNLIDDYINGLKQERPLIIWCEEAAIRDPHSFANNLSNKYFPKVAFYNWAGSPLTGHKKQFKDGKVAEITLEERMSFCIPKDVIRIDDDGSLISKVYIHSPVMCTIGENGLTSIEYGQMIHEKLHLPVILLFHESYRPRIIADMSGYDQYICK